MTIDFHPIKHQMTAILDFFFSETLKITNSFKNEFSINNHVKIWHYNKIYIKGFRNYNFNIAFGGNFEFCQKKRCFAQWKLWDSLKVIKKNILAIYRLKGLYVF